MTYVKKQEEFIYFEFDGTNAAAAQAWMNDNGVGYNVWVPDDGSGYSNRMLITGDIYPTDSVWDVRPGSVLVSKVSRFGPSPAFAIDDPDRYVAT